MELSIFMSYSPHDKAVAQEIAAGLAARNVKVWIDEGELRIGDSLIQRITEALDEVHFVVALVSPYSVQSPWCQKEISLAMTGGLRRKGVKVLPLRVGNVQMPAALSDVLYLDVDPNYPLDCVDRLVRDAMHHQGEHDRATSSRIPFTVPQTAGSRPSGRSYRSIVRSAPGMNECAAFLASC